MRLGVIEDEHAHRVHADIRSVDKQDIHVAVGGNEVSITAESKSGLQRGGERDIVTERAPHPCRT
ncbi:MAG TPA: Hsp20 family protein [Rhodanobacteraceae bacterium]|nr:Hsp20 family protein [Rhodanobacteraceae bacterium]